MLLFLVRALGDNYYASYSYLDLECDYNYIKEVDVNDPWSKGCVVPEPPKCRDGDVFAKIPRSEYEEWDYLDNYNYTLVLSECWERCFRNCSCMAYAFMDSDIGTGCRFSQFKKPNYSVTMVGPIYFRNNTVCVLVPPGPSPPKSPNNTAVETGHPTKKRTLWLIVGAIALSLAILIVFCIFCCLRCYSRGKDISS